MATALEREADELWTSYLRRRLRQEGFEMPKLELDTFPERGDEEYFASSLALENDALLLEVDRNMVVKPATSTDSQINQATKISEISDLVREEVWVGVTFKQDSDEPSCRFSFGRDSTATVAREIPSNAHAFFDGYQEKNKYDANKVVDEIIRYVREGRFRLRSDSKAGMQPGELGTSYLLRKLKAARIDVPEFKHTGQENNKDFFNIEINLADEYAITLERATEEASHSLKDIKRAQRHSELEGLRRDIIRLYIGGNPAYNFTFKDDGKVIVEEADEKNIGPWLGKYETGKTYQASEIVDDLVAFALAKGENKPGTITPDKTKKASAPDASGRETAESGSRTQRAETETDGGQTAQTLAEILRTVKNLERHVETHPMTLKEDGEYLSELYTRTINREADNLRSFRYQGETIHYVLVHSSELEGMPGRVFNNLYFVARNYAREDWQQKIIAYHESMCAKIGHEEAKEKEIELARKLGKAAEYKEWRAQIDRKTRRKCSA